MVKLINKEGKPTGITSECPYCRNKIIAELKHYYINKDKKKLERDAIVKCPNPECLSAFFIRILFSHENIIVKSFTYPQNIVAVSDFHESIPEDIRKNMAEAHNCYNIGALNAAALMARVVVEDIAIDKNIEAYGIKEKIEQLYKKKIINERIYQLADKLRIFGNLSAHRDIGLSLNQYDAVAVEIGLKFLNLITDHIYKVEFEINLLDEIHKEKTQNGK